jgi:hypothetical protein
VRRRKVPEKRETYVNDTLTLVSHTEELNTELLHVLLEGHDLETGVGPVKRDNQLPLLKQSSNRTHSLMKDVESVY